MKAAAISGVKQIEIVDVPMPVIGPRDVLLKIKSAGLCTWEQRIYTGQAKSDYPLVGGHENAGEIAAVGELVTNVNDVKENKPFMVGENLKKHDNTNPFILGFCSNQKTYFKGQIAEVKIYDKCYKNIKTSVSKEKSLVFYI